MKIEIAEPGRMTQSGSSLLKLIQNNNMPILDLLVRESIQNSLDAKNEQDSYVMVEFFTGEFRKGLLNNELEGITSSLNKKYWKDNYNFIAVRDSNTVGLTGKLHYDEVMDNQYGNLLKLIYEISKPQEAEGAGGSWGLGKTVYFRVGIGLVIYYSRIKNESGQYESRLAASLVENELDRDSLIPAIPGKSKRGIAWWGQKIGENKTKPITDEVYIKKVLNIFNIKPYEGESTGTTIIIPYVDDNMLLEHNQIEYKDGEEKKIRPFWTASVEEYLRVAIQRWYAPRLNNVNYPYGKFLRAKVNNRGIGLDNMEPAFQVVHALYNRAIGFKDIADILSYEGVQWKAEDVALRKVLETTKAGTVAYAKIPRKYLRTEYPDNKPEPYMYFNCEIRDKEKNKPVLFFTRKPGMIVSYEDVGNWVDGISASNKDEFIFAIFVLNSDNKLQNTTNSYSLEEYVRKSEMADHTSWGDFSMGNNNPRIVSKIQSQVNNKISREFSVEEEETTARANSGLGKLFGDLLLPPEGFGKRSGGAATGGSGGGKHKETHKSIVFEYNPFKTIYSQNTMIVNLNLKSRKELQFMGVDLEIDSESGAIKASDWEKKMGLTMPFEIVSTEIKVLKLDGKTSELKMNVDYSNTSVRVENFVGKLEQTNNQSGYGIRVLLDEPHQLEIGLAVKLKLHRKDIKPLFNVKKNEGDK